MQQLLRPHKQRDRTPIRWAINQNTANGTDAGRWGMPQGRRGILHRKGRQQSSLAPNQPESRMNGISGPRNGNFRG